MCVPCTASQAMLIMLWLLHPDIQDEAGTELQREKRKAGRTGGQEGAEDRKRRGGPWEEGAPRSTGPENSVPPGYLSSPKRAAVSAGWLRGETPWSDFRKPAQCARARSEDHAPPWPRGDVTAPLEPPTDWRELGWPERARSALPGQRWWCRWAPSCAGLPGACSVGSRLATSDSRRPATGPPRTVEPSPRCRGDLLAQSCHSGRPGRRTSARPRPASAHLSLRPST